jgi:hypothetical protein
MRQRLRHTMPGLDQGAAENGVAPHLPANGQHCVRRMTDEAIRLVLHQQLSRLPARQRPGRQQLHGNPPAMPAIDKPKGFRCRGMQPDMDMDPRLGRPELLRYRGFEILGILRRPAAGQLPLNAVLGGEEPQGQVRTPIFPRVAQQIGLNFSDTDWVDNEIALGMTSDLRTYLRLYYYPDGVILGPLDNARILSQAAASPVTPDTRLFARPQTANAAENPVDYELLEILHGPKIISGPQKTFTINPNEWRSTWIF